VSKAQTLANQINAALGANTVIMGNNKDLEVTYLPTGVVPIDHLLQGGLPFGRFIEMFGDYSTLKSYVGLKAIASAQKSGMLAALIDTEHAFDPNWARECGVKVEELIYKQPETAEEAFDIAEALIRAGINLVVFDSVAAALPQQEQKKRMHGESVQPARLAAAMSTGLRKLTSANKKTAILFINQTRINVGIMFGNPEAVPGGKALPFYASYRVALRKAGKVTEDVTVYFTDNDGKPKKKKIKQTIGQQIRASVEKSKLNAPHRETMFTFDLRESCVDEKSYLINLGLEHGVIFNDTRGNWWTRADERKIKGLPSFKATMKLEELKMLVAGYEPLLAPTKEEQQKLKGSYSRGRLVRVKKRVVKLSG
jgi:recombination protein RecA